MQDKCNNDTQQTQTQWNTIKQCWIVIKFPVS